MEAIGQARDEVELLREFRSGSRDAFELLFRRYQAEVYGWAVRILHDRSLAEDATIEAFWRIWRSHARLDPDRGFAAWARRIVTHSAVDLLHQMGREAAAVLPEEIPAPATPERDPEAERAVRGAFLRLPVKLRVAARLSLVEERTSAEIAQALGISVPAVKSRVFRAIRQLRKSLSRLEVLP